MKLILVFLLTTVFALSVEGYAQDTIYKQKVRRDRGLKKIRWDKRGEIILTQDSVIFDCKKHKELNLALSYGDIKRVRRYNDLWLEILYLALLCPDPFLDYGVKIKMKSGEKYRFSTFKRKKIVKIIRSKIAG